MRVFVTGGTGFGWEPAEPGLIEDIDARHYANAASTHQPA